MLFPQWGQSVILKKVTNHRKRAGNKSIRTHVGRVEHVQQGSEIPVDQVCARLYNIYMLYPSRLCGVVSGVDVVLSGCHYYCGRRRLH